jgi:maltose-binding protein MalE
MGRQAGTSRAAVLLGVLALLAAGCGSSHPAASTTATTTTTTTSSTTATSTTAATTTTSGTPNLSLLTSGNCRELLGLSASFAQAMEGNTQNLEKSAQLVQQFADKTPAAIRPDFEVLAADWTKVAAALKGVNLTSGKAPSASVMARLVTLSSKLNTQQLTQASQDITAWAHTNCGTTGG